MKWGWVNSNPANDLDLPSTDPYKRKQWTEKETMMFIEKCEDKDISTATSVMFSATLRSGELAGLTWDCVDISEDAITRDCCSVRVEKTIERLPREVIRKSKNDVIRVFPSTKPLTSTVVVMKRPKTTASIRTVYIPQTVAKLLREHYHHQTEHRDQLGEQYNDYNLVFCHADGKPYTSDYIGKRFKKNVKCMDLEAVDFYALRHSGATAKLRATGDIKAVQGDMGHSSPDMLLNVYAEIRDEDRRNIARTMDTLWFSSDNKNNNTENLDDME